MPSEQKIAVSNILSAVRSASGMTQKQMGKELGVAAKQVRRYEFGEVMPPESRLKRIFHIGLKLAVPIIERLPYYVPVVLTWEVINEIREAVRKEQAQEASEKARLEEITSEIAAQTEKACQARDTEGDKNNQG